MIIYLYVKRHSKTGLKYFGKTSRPDPHTYLGSGSYWRKHVNKHGKEYVETLNIWTFDKQDHATAFALEFSNNNAIVESTEWANLKLEDALDGGSLGRVVTSDTRKKISEAKRGKPSNRKGAKQTDDARLKMSLSRQGKKEILKPK